MYETKGVFATAQASRYLQQLCKHFAHKVEVSYDASSGRVRFPFGLAVLAADESGLAVTIHAEEKSALDRGRRVIDSHLERFAFREAFSEMDWEPAQLIAKQAGGSLVADETP